MHAELDAIYHAARFSIPTVGGTLYVVWYACPDCAKGIISAGIKRVVGSLEAFHQGNENERWRKPVEVGLTMLMDAGVEVHWLNADLGVEIRLNEKRVRL